MSLSREKFESLGGAFSVEGESYPSDPDIRIWAADLTIDGHTHRFTGKSEEIVLDSAKGVLIARGADLS